MSKLDKYFEKYRNNIIGSDETFMTPFGEQKVIYADWIASGRMYRGIEDKLINNFYPYVANTHTDSTITGASMIGSAKEPAYAVDAAAVRAAARTSFFIT